MSAHHVDHIKHTVDQLTTLFIMHSKNVNIIRSDNNYDKGMYVLYHDWYNYHYINVFLYVTLATNEILDNSEHVLTEKE